MTGTDFDPSKRTIEDLFVSRDYYVIPRFQRPYSWESTNLEDFWRDVVYDNPVGYFIGPMVAWREPGSPIARLVDGQQRMTTISLLFAILRDSFDSLGETGLAEGTQRYLEKRNRDNELKFTLQTEANNDFLNLAIFSASPSKNIKPKTEEERQLKQAHETLAKSINQELTKRSSPVSWLKELRDKILGLQVIWIENGDEDAAYILFETLNSRGKNLEVVDLLKNHIFNRLRPATSNIGADEVRKGWEEFRNAIHGSEEQREFNVNRFILHWWISKEEYVAERKLFSSIKKQIKSPALAKECLASLQVDSVNYRKALEPLESDWQTEERDASEALIALATFGAVQPAPLLLALVRERRQTKNKLSAKQFNRTLKTIENFHFQHSVVSGQRSSGGTSEMYAKAARELSKASGDAQEIANVLADFRGKLVDRIPERDLFLASFTERFFYSEIYSRESKLVRYVLKKFLKQHHPTTNLGDLTFEHIHPQSETDDTYTDEIVASIGNLILVSEEVNRKLGTKPFSQKVKILAGEGSVYDIGGVVDCSEWNLETISARAKLLGEEAYDSIWKASR